MRTKSGKLLHPIGIGTWGINSTINQNDLGSKYRGAEPVRGNEEEGIEAIRYSISKGQNHIDCAELHGGFYTDEVVGRALKGLNRENLYIADKLWKTSLGTGLVRGTVKKMLEKLGTDYLDLLYIHAPFYDAPWQEAIMQIDELIDTGLVRGFGVSNFKIVQLEEAMKIAKHPIVANQINYNVLHKTEADQALRDFCEQHNIKFIAWMPIKQQAVLHDEVIKKIARYHGATPAQVSLSWLISKGSLPIPKATKKEHIDENLDSVGLRLTDKDIQRLDLL